MSKKIEKLKVISEKITVPVMEWNKELQMFGLGTKEIDSGSYVYPSIEEITEKLNELIDAFNSLNNNE